MTAAERARALVAGMADKTEFLTEDNIQRLCAIAAAGLDQQEALSELFAYMPGTISPEMARFAGKFAEIRQQYDAAIAQAVWEGGEG